MLSAFFRKPVGASGKDNMYKVILLMKAFTNVTMSPIDSRFPFHPVGFFSTGSDCERANLFSSIGIPKYFMGRATLG
jgi:hypothetical protein